MYLRIDFNLLNVDHFHTMNPPIQEPPRIVRSNRRMAFWYPMRGYIAALKAAPVVLSHPESLGDGGRLKALVFLLDLRAYALWPVPRTCCKLGPLERLARLLVLWAGWQEYRRNILSKVVQRG